MANKSSFKFIDYIISRSIFDSKPELKESDFDIKIEPSGLIRGNEFQLFLKLKVWNEEESSLIMVEAIGLFQFEGEYETIKNYFLLNAPAILFPYVRAYISGLTALSGRDTITIPAMNLSSLKDELEENIEFIEESE